MIVRRLTETDLAECIRVGARMHEESDYADLEYSPERCLALGRAAVADPDQYGWFIAERGGEIVGMMGGHCCPAYFSDDKVAEDFLVYVKPAARGGLAFLMLVKAFVSWSKESGARMIHLADSANMEGAIGALYERLGFTRIGGVYRRKI